MIPSGTPSYAGGVPSSRLPFLTAKLQGFGTTIFAEMSALALATGSVNLGQGFPDTDGPPEVLDAAVQAIRDGADYLVIGRQITRAADPAAEVDRILMELATP